MSKYLGPKCRLCRREGEKLFLKGERCEGQKCAILRKNYAPGMHGKNSFGKKSEYSKQLREKQKAKRTFGLLEKPFRMYYEKASKSKEETGITFLKILETRLDNSVYRSGLTASRGQARQAISHGLIYLNGKKVTIPSIIIKVGDKFKVSEKKSGSKLFEKVKTKKDLSPSWLNSDLKNLSCEIVAMPEKDHVESNINSQLIVEFYSK